MQFILKKIMPVFIVVIMMFSYYSAEYQKAEAFFGVDDAVVLTAGCVLVLATCIVACGIMMNNDTDLQTAVNEAWGQCTDSIKGTITNIANNLVPGASNTIIMAGAEWTILSTTIVSMFGHNLGNVQLTPFTGFVQGGTVAPAWTNQTTWAIKTCNVAANYVYHSNNLTYNITQSATGMTYALTLGSGVILTAAMSPPSTVMNTNQVNQLWINTPYIYADTAGKNRAEFTVSVPIGQTQGVWTSVFYYNFKTFKISNFDPAVDGQTLYCNTSTGKIYTGSNDSSGTHYYGDPAVFYSSVSQWVYDEMLNTGTMNVYIDGMYYPYDEATGQVKSIPNDQTVTLDVPADIAAVQESTASDVISAADSLPYTLPKGHIDLSPFANVNLTDKFPFCLPFDLIRGIQALISTPQAPSFDIDLSGSKYLIGGSRIHFDLSNFDTVATVARWFETMLFIIMLIMITRRIMQN